MARAGLPYDEAVAKSQESNWRYNEYVDASEKVRSLIGSDDPIDFYTNLLKVPVAARSAYLTKELVQSGRVSLSKELGKQNIRLIHDLNKIHLQ